MQTPATEEKTLWLIARMRGGFVVAAVVAQ